MAEKRKEYFLVNDDDDNSDAVVGPSSWSFQPFPLCPGFSLYPLFTDFTCSSSSSFVAFLGLSVIRTRTAWRYVYWDYVRH